MGTISRVLPKQPPRGLSSSSSTSMHHVRHRALCCQDVNYSLISRPFHLLKNKCHLNNASESWTRLSGRRQHPSDTVNETAEPQCTTKEVSKDTAVTNNGSTSNYPKQTSVCSWCKVTAALELCIRNVKTQVLFWMPHSKTLSLGLGDRASKWHTLFAA